MSKTLDTVLNSAPCVQCDGSGGIQISEDEAEQCQFCWQLRYKFIEEAKADIKDIMKSLTDDYYLEAYNRSAKDPVYEVMFELREKINNL